MGQVAVERRAVHPAAQQFLEALGGASEVRAGLGGVVVQAQSFLEGRLRLPGQYGVGQVGRHDRQERDQEGTGGHVAPSTARMNRSASSARVGASPSPGRNRAVSHAL